MRPTCPAASRSSSIGAEFCFVADRRVADPIARFGSAWDAHAKLAEQLVVAACRPDELVALMADNFSTPDPVLFEQDLRAAVDRRLRRLALVSVVRLDSRSSDGLQAVDLLTSAVAHELRADAGLAGWRNGRHSVQIFRDRS